VVEQVSGAAERAGIQPGDVVLQLNGTPVATPDQLREAVAKSGKRAALLIQRDNRQLFVPVDMG
jgi:serine protease Do